jgi:hypothetical protein
MAETSMSSLILNREWPRLTSEAPDAQARTWGDFLVHLTARLPPKRKTETLDVRTLGWACALA